MIFLKKQKLSFKTLVEQHLEILKGLQYDSGLFAASKADSSTGYGKPWLRDNFYECLAFMVAGDFETVRKTYKALLAIFLKHEYKIDHAIKKKPEHKHQYIHARFHPHTFDEYWEDWGNKQHDAVGAILFGIALLEGKYKVKILETEGEKRVVKKLVDYLGSIMYWCDPDSGMWEENEEIHASSVGACVAGLSAIKKYTGIPVPDHYIAAGEKTLAGLLPRESKKKFVDIALLSLIYPYDIVAPAQRDEILTNVEYHLEKKKGIIRYKGDHYYNKNPDGHSEEAEWTFGFSWLSIIYELMGKKAKAKEYLKKAMRTINENGEIPELYFSNSDKFVNSPLGWSESMFVIALHNFNEKHIPGDVSGAKKQNVSAKDRGSSLKTPMKKK